MGWLSLYLGYDYAYKKDYEVFLAEVQRISLDYGAVIALAEGMGLPDSELGRMETVSATLDGVTKWVTEWKER